MLILASAQLAEIEDNRIPLGKGTDARGASPLVEISRPPVVFLRTCPPAALASMVVYSPTPPEPLRMAKHISKLSKSLRDLGDLQVNDWQLPGVLNKDISELEVNRALKRLGRIQVTEWELKEVLPAIQRLARKEVDVVGLMKKAADYKVLDWELADAFHRLTGSHNIRNRKEVEAISARLEGYLEFVVRSLIDEPQYASFHRELVAPDVVRFKVVLSERDHSTLIGMDGRTVSPIRRLLKSAAEHHGIHALLKVQTHIEAATPTQDTD